MKNGWYQDKFGDLRHYANNKCHNENSPVVIWINGNKFWYQNYKWHRIDGPAVEYSDGDKYWWYQDKEINCKSQQEFERIIKLKILW